MGVTCTACNSNKINKPNKNINSLQKEEALKKVNDISERKSSIMLNNQQNEENLNFEEKEKVDSQKNEENSKSSFIIDNHEENSIINKLKSLSDDENEHGDYSTNEKNIGLNKKNLPFYYMSKYHIYGVLDFSTEYDYNSILKISNTFSKSILSLKLLLLKERQWMKELILNSEFLKKNRKTMSKSVIIEYLNQRLKLSEHFNSISWAITFYYQSLIYSESSHDRIHIFKHDECSLPAVDSLEWINGFEWKGLYIRIQKNSQTYELEEEIRLLKVLFIEYLQVVENKVENFDEKFLSNEIIFPLITTTRIYGVSMVVSVIIPSTNAEKSVLFGYNERNQRQVKDNLNIDDNREIFDDYGMVNNSIECKYFNNDSIIDNDINKGLFLEYCNKYKENQYLIMRNIEFSVFSYDNTYKEINDIVDISFYSKKDFSFSFLLRRIEKNNLLRVNDDIYNSNINNKNNSPNKNYTYISKYLLVNIKSLFPDLVPSTEKLSLIIPENDSRRIEYIHSGLTTNNHFSEKDYLTDVIRKIYNENDDENVYIKKNISEKKKNLLMENILFNNEKYFKVIDSFELFSYPENISYKIKYCSVSNRITKEETEESPYKKINSRVNSIIYLCKNNLKVPSFSIFDMIDNKRFYSKFKFVNNIFFNTHQSDKSTTNHNNNNLLYSTDHTANIIHNQIKGPCIMEINLRESIKIGYSLIPGLNFPYKNLSPNYIMNFSIHIENFIKVLNLNETIENSDSLNSLFTRYSIPYDLKYFLIPRVKLSKVSDVMKIEILCDLIEKTLFFHEGINFLYKIYYINLNNHVKDYEQAMKENLTVINEGFFQFIKEKNLYSILKEKIYQSILCIFAMYKAQSSFVNFFFEQINIHFFMYIQKLRVINKSLFKNRKNQKSENSNENEINNDIEYYSCIDDLFSNEYTEIFIKNLILTANERPFLFLSTIENKLQFVIEPSIKFKSSISKDQFIENFNSGYILEKELIVNSIFTSKEVVDYLYTDLSPNEEEYDEMLYDEINENMKVLGPKMRKVEKKEKLSRIKSITIRKGNENNKSKVSSQINKSNSSSYISSFYENNDSSSNINRNVNSNMYNSIENDFVYEVNNKYNKDNDNDKYRISSNNQRLNKINTNNIKDNSIKKDKDKDKDQENLFKLNLYNKIQNEYDFHLSSNLYKLRSSVFFKDCLKNKENKKDNDDKEISINSNNYILKYKYSIGKLKKIKEWRNRCYSLYDNIYSVYPIESNIIHILYILFYFSLFIEKDLNKSKDFLYSIKEYYKKSHFFVMEHLSLFKLLEGILIEKQNYINSENFYSSFSVILLYIKGDPRGKGSYSDPLLLFPLWKLARQTSILEEDFGISENFKEMFYSLDYIEKTIKKAKEIIIEQNNSHNQDNNNNNENEEDHIKDYNSYINDIMKKYKLNKNENEKGIENTKNRLNYKNDDYQKEDYFNMSFFNLIYDSSIKFNKNEGKNINFLSKSLDFPIKNNHFLKKINKNDNEDVNDENIQINSICYMKNNDCISIEDDNEKVNSKESMLEDHKIFYLIDDNYIINKDSSFEFPSISNIKKESHISSNSSFIFTFLKWVMSFMTNSINTNFFNMEFINNKLFLDIINQNDNTSQPTVSSYRSFPSIINNNNHHNFNHMSNIFENIKEYSLLNNMKDALSKKNSKVNGRSLLSNTLYDVLLKKFSFKICPPKGFLLSFGFNNKNQTSHSNYDYLPFPRLCFKLKDEIVDKVCCGWDFTMALTRSKNVYSWGNNEYGQCGVPKQASKYNKNEFINKIHSPTKMKSTKKFVTISAGNEFSFGVDGNGNLFGWGKNEGGVLCFTLDNQHSNGNTDLFNYNPILVKDIKVKLLSTGSLHCIGIDIENKLFSWGSGEGGQLGISEKELILNSNKGCVYSPTQFTVSTHVKIIKISCGEVHSLALSKNGEVYSWGLGISGQLGNGKCGDSYEPGKGMISSRVFEPEKIICFINNQKGNSNIYDTIVDIVCGKSSSYFINQNGELYSCGSNEFGQLGLKKEVYNKNIYSNEDYYICYDVVFPTIVTNLSKMKVKKIVSGESHCLAIIEETNNHLTSIWSWGFNKYGQLGNNNIQDINLPNRIDYINKYESCRIVDISCGAFHSLCLLSNFSQSKTNLINESIENFILHFKIWRSSFYIS